MKDYSVFEGKKSVRTVGRQTDRDLFADMKKQLGFKNDIDLVTFCAALALRMKHDNVKIRRRKLPYPKKLVGMESFEKKILYDNIVMELLSVEENRLVEFETLFYTGLRFLKERLDDFVPYFNSELERFSVLWDEIDMEPEEV